MKLMILVVLLFFYSEKKYQRCLQIHLAFVIALPAYTKKQLDKVLKGSDSK